MRVFSLFSILVILRCASISKQECELGEWEQMGQVDGTKGLGEAQVLKYIKGCRKHNAIVDKRRYLKGLHLGLTDFCKQKGSTDGSEGNTNDYLSQCSAHQNDYESGVKMGLKNFCTESKAYEFGKVGKTFSFSKCNETQKSELKLSFDKGIFQYCRVENAFAMGKDNRGTPHFSHCNYSFKSAYEDGKSLRAIITRMEELKDDKEDLRKKSYEDDISQSEKYRLMRDVARLDRQYEELMRDRINLEERYR